ENLYEHVKSAKSHELLHAQVQTGGQAFVKRLVSQIDELSQKLRLHQHECCFLVEEYLQNYHQGGASSSAGSNAAATKDLVKDCQNLFYNEQQHAACVLLDLAQQLSSYMRARTAGNSYKGGASSSSSGNINNYRDISSAVSSHAGDFPVYGTAHPSGASTARGGGAHSTTMAQQQHELAMQRQQELFTEEVKLAATFF
ncbi:unnamed protein product, partial [Amoebophrya sp. A120]